MYPIGTVARARNAQAAGLLNDDGSLVSPLQTTRLTPSNRFLIEGAEGKLIYVRLLDGKYTHHLAAIPRQDLDVVGRTADLLIA